MTDRTSLLNEINAVSFALSDLTLYLDTHPDCSEGLALFRELAPNRKQLLADYARISSPLTIDCATDVLPENDHFSWLDGPMPWEGGIL